MNKKKWMFLTIIMLVIVLSVIGVFVLGKDSGIDPNSNTTDTPSAQGHVDVERTADHANLVESSEPTERARPQTSSDATASSQTTIPDMNGNSIPDAEGMDYKSFHAMSPTQQQAYVESFENLDLFFAWYNAARDAYDVENPTIVIDDGVVDMSSILGED